MNNNFESYWKNEGQFLDYVNKNYDKEAELKEFARQVSKECQNHIDELERTIEKLEEEKVYNKDKWD